MKVLIAHARYAQPGGEEAVVEAQTTVLRERGHDVELFVQDNADTTNGALSQLQIAANSLWSLRSRRDIAEAISRFRPDVLHVHNNFHGMSPSIYGAARAANVPVVQHIHNARLVCINGFLERDGGPCDDCVGKATRWPGLKHRCYRDSVAGSVVATAVEVTHRAARTWTREVDLFLPVSQSLADVVIADGVVPAAKVVVCPNGLANDPGARSKADDGYVVFAGRLSPEKGVDVLISAAALAPNVRVVVAGDGPSATDLRALASNLPNVEFRGRLERDALNEVMRGARALVVPSVGREPFGMTIVEAAALGVPAIASATGGITEIVVDNETGQLVPPGDPVALAAALEADTDFAAMGRAARQRFEAHYSPDAFASRLLAAYEPLLP